MSNLPFEGYVHLTVRVLKKVAIGVMVGDMLVSLIFVIWFMWMR